MSDTDTERGERRDTAARVRRGLDYALLGGLVLLGAFAALQFYFAADRTINVWVTREYRPPFKMVFNLVVLLVVGVGLSRQLRRLTGDDGSDGGASDGQSTDTTTNGGQSHAATTTPGPAKAERDSERDHRVDDPAVGVDADDSGTDPERS